MKLMKLLLSILILTMTMPWTAVAGGKKTCRFGPIRIGVIDTGFGYQSKGIGAPLCNYGHKDFSIFRRKSTIMTLPRNVPVDVHGHGTNVAGLIAEYASKGNNKFCLVIIKYYSDAQTGSENQAATTKAFQYATNLKLEYVNYSGGGAVADEKERKAVLAYLKTGGKLIAAAGNEGKDLDGVINAYYPAMYDKRIMVVGNKNIYGNKTDTSNYGAPVTTWEVGQNQTAFGITMSGTSQATAITTGKAVSAESSCDR